MKDVIEEQRKHLLEVFVYGTAEAPQRAINEAFLKIANEADFIISRLQGEAGIVERAAEAAVISTQDFITTMAKLPGTARLLRSWAKVLRGYAARVENSEAPEFNERTVPVDDGM